MMVQDTGYDNMPSVLFVCQSTKCWIDTSVNIHVCVDISCFPLTRSHEIAPFYLGTTHMLQFVVLSQYI